jgi:hypothetical protein
MGGRLVLVAAALSLLLGACARPATSESTDDKLYL